jgi:hypothetical protein
MNIQTERSAQTGNTCTDNHNLGHDHLPTDDPPGRRSPGNTQCVTCADAFTTGKRLQEHNERFSGLVETFFAIQKPCRQAAHEWPAGRRRWMGPGNHLPGGRPPASSGLMGRPPTRPTRATKLRYHLIGRGPMYKVAGQAVIHPTILSAYV